MANKAILLLKRTRATLGSNEVSLSPVSAEIGTINLYSIVIVLSAGSLSAINPEAGWSITFTDEEIETEVTAISGSISDDTITLTLDESILPFTTVAVSYFGGDLLQDGTPVADIAEFEADNNYPWELNDNFSATAAAGSIPADAEPGPGTRTVIDASSLISLADGKLQTNTNAAWTDGLRYDLVTKFTGRAVFAKIMNTDARFNALQLRSTTNINQVPVSAPNVTIKGNFNNAEISTVSNSVKVGSWDYFQWYNLAIVFGSNSVYFFRDSTLLYLATGVTLFDFYPTLNGTPQVSAINYAEFLRIPNATILPTPLAYDTFASSVTIAADSGSNGLDGTFVNCGLGGANGVFFNGTTSYVNIYSASLNSLFDGQEFGVVVRAKVSNVGVWTDGQIRNIIQIGAGISNRVTMYKNPGSNSVAGYYTAGGVSKSFNAGISSSELFGMGITASLSGDIFSGYMNGASLSTYNSLGTYSGSLSSAWCTIGSYRQSSQFWNGWIKDVVITLNGVVPTDAQMNYLTNTANTITTAYLDAQFGAGNYVWYKLDEKNSTLSSGPESQAITPLDWDTLTGRITSGKLANTPTLGSELVTNGDFSAWTGDDPDGWTVIGESGSDPEVSEVGSGEVHGGSGTGLCNIYTSGSFVGIRQSIVAAGVWYRSVIDIDTVVSGAVLIRDIAGIPVSSSYSTTGAKTATFIWAHPTGTMSIDRNGATDITVASFSLKEIDLSSCVSALAVAEINSVIVSRHTITANTQNMIWVGLDDYTNPQNGITVVPDRIDGKIKVYKVDASSWGSALIDVAFTYSADAEIQISYRDDNSLWIWYNGAYIGNATIAMPAGAGTDVGFFNLDEASRISEVQVMPYADYDSLLNPYALEVT